MNESFKNTKKNSQALEASRILDVALEMACEQDNWYDLSLVELAKRCGMSVNGVRRYYADTNAIADAWFSQALEAMLSSEFEIIETLPVKERLEFIIWRWFEALAPYHQVTAQMLGAKLHPPHIHHWVPMVFDLSRLVQLWRDAAGLHASGRRRQLEELALTGIFLATLRAWCRDESPQQTQAYSRLSELLTEAERAAKFWFSPETR
ncbi:MAG: TetR/AcrR family transcriptional regulator [Chromatiales bacterium]|nr:TetR/AcrR family transcriptional regulator [Chromatiales bacterium]